jgi:hypothetical protein
MIWTILQIVFQNILWNLADIFKNLQWRHNILCLFSRDNEDHTDRNMAMALAITTFLKQVGVQRTNVNSRFLERCSSFIEKDKKMFRFKGSRKVGIAWSVLCT